MQDALLRSSDATEGENNPVSYPATLLLYTGLYLHSSAVDDPRQVAFSMVPQRYFCFIWQRIHPNVAAAGNMATQAEDSDLALQEQANFTALMQAIMGLQTTLTSLVSIAACVVMYVGNGRCE